MARASRLGTGFRSATMAARAVQDEALPPADAKPKRRRPVTRTQLSIYMRPDLTNQIRDACAHLHQTMTAFFERAAEAELHKLSKSHRGGRSFPARRGEHLPTGPQLPTKDQR